ncbi:family 16 glycosylhydrolase [Fulvivirga sp. M361]|uniref:RICIN domain-containing protein n=1 Tax=Fulvivirga sp. M361 TaxID=2594266 RepID=UPI001179F349|nr:RICIN domain-containing protein [Fulvivirga sp. M361]TRX62026.1 family 16 glycosylhydrolase [Fulvivirga sp. M361]
MKILKFTCLLAFLWVSSSVSFAQPPGSGWENPVFQDEFNDNSINTGKWRVRNDAPFVSWTVNEVQVEGRGVLRIENVTNTAGAHFGGWMDSKQKYGNGAAFPKYGYYEAMVKIDNAANGQIWPTWWIWGDRINGFETTEFDMMEYSGFSSRWNNNKASSSHHFRNDNVIGGDDRSHTHGDNNRNAFSWHRWGVLWTPTEVSFWYDGNKYFESVGASDAAAEVYPLKLIFSSTPHVIDGYNGFNDPVQPDNPIQANTPQPGAALPSLLVDWVRVWQGGNPPGGGGGSNPVVTMRKGNATNFSIDGGDGGANGQNVRLWTYYNHVNQQWVEIDRGSGYYTYKKRNTNFCLDGGNGGADGQNVYLWSCQNNNQNQHWRKVNLGGGKFRLEKRNASGFSIDGNAGGANNQNLYLWSSSNGNPNQQWSFTNVGTANARLAGAELPNPATVDESLDKENLIIYPNPLTEGKLNLSVDLQERNTIGLRVFDNAGKLLYENAMGEYISGTHILTFSTDELKMHTKGLFILEVNIGGAYDYRKVIIY